MKSVITEKRRKKMADATQTTGRIAKAKWIALGSGGVNSAGEVIVPLSSSLNLKSEIVRKEITSSRKISETTREYSIFLSKNEQVGKFFSELALIDEDGDVIAFANFLSKGKDDAEVTYSIEDVY